MDKKDIDPIIEDLPLPPLGIPSVPTKEEVDLAKKILEEANKSADPATVKPHQAVVGVFKSIWNWLKGV